MVRGIGIDIVENRRFLTPDEHLLEKLFTEREREEASKRVLKEEYYASRFAAKEAFAKALGTGFRGFSPIDVEIMENELGQPYVALNDKTRPLVESLDVFLSLSHEKDNSIAMVVLDGKI